MDAKYSLKHLKDDLELEVHELSSLIGRSANCDIQVDRETLSREHARLTQRAGTLYLQDLHSTNGSFVNDKQIHDATPVRPGDTLRFGQEAFSLTQSNVDATMVFNRSALANSDSAMLVEDEDEADGTVMLQSISLPAGWDSSAQASDPGFTLAEGDKALLNALKKHTQTKLHHTFGLMVAITSENKAPAVKLVSTDNKHASWFIGRGYKSDVVLDDQRVSDLHAEISYEEGKWTVKDCNSRNGTIANGRAIKVMEIGKKASLEIGPFNLLLEPINK